MKYSALVFVSLLITVHSFGQAPDTVFLLKENKGGVFHAIFIDSNKQSRYYSEISNFAFDDFDHDSYDNSLRYLKNNGIRLMRQPVKGISKQWVVIKQYKNNFYAYRPSDFMYHYKISITDTSFVDYTGEGPTASKIVSFSKVDDATYKFRLTGLNAKERDLTIYIIDKQKGIALFCEANYSYLMIPVQNVRDIPIIVNYCATQKQVEFQFDMPDYNKLIGKRLVK